MKTNASRTSLAANPRRTDARGAHDEDTAPSRSGPPAGCVRIRPSREPRPATPPEPRRGSYDGGVRATAVSLLALAAAAAGCGPSRVIRCPLGVEPAALAEVSRPAVHAAPADGEPDPLPDDLRVGSRPWLDTTGTSIVGFGLLRLVPDPGRKARFHLRYRETATDYGGGTDGEYQLFVLPGDAFAAKPRAYADEFLAFTRTHGSLRAGSTYTLAASVEADRETTVIVAYGPWTAPDAGRPAGDRPVFRLDVRAEGGAFEWLESEAGELITTNWTNRPGVARGGPYPRDNVWIEVQPLILYDGRMVRAADEAPLTSFLLPAPAEPASDDPEARRRAADRRQESADLAAASARADRRIVMTRELAARFRRVPIRWR